MIRQYELVDRVRAYDPAVNEALLNRAYVFSMKAHGKQTRASGDPYFMHPLEVAGILTRMKLDSDTIATALLHDVVEDTGTTVAEIEEIFGPKVAELVDGVTKLSQLELQTENSREHESIREAENFRKFLLAMSNDIRVLLVKLADRLHNMRTLNHIKKEEKRRRKALETVEIYAPLAERLGMREIKDELEELAFEQLYPEGFETVMARMALLRSQSEGVIEEVIAELQQTLDDAGLSGEVHGREKRPYSIWKKMERQHIPFEKIADVVAFRLILHSETECYRALGVVHQKWAMVPGRFKDYISLPKRNNYRSIHTTVIGPRKMRIEIQIRTREMHEVAELGVAAHWQYKQSDGKVEGHQYQWLRGLLEILEHDHSPEEFLEHTKLEMFTDQVFCFTPKGALISLPRGSTAVDFAFAVHTEVGTTCVGAKVNGRILPLRHQLQNGDQVEILTSSGQSPNPRWESFVITGKARSAIRRHVRQQQRQEYANLGRTILEKAFRAEDIEFSDKALQPAMAKLRVVDLDEIFEAVARGTLSERDVLRAALPGITLHGDSKKIPRVTKDWNAKDGAKGGESGIPIRGLTPGVAVHLADCCHPLPGDRIVGIKSKGMGVMIHTIDCEALEAFSETPDRWLDISWHGAAEQPDFYAGRLKLVVLNEAGALAHIAAVTAKHGGNISNLKISDRDPEFFTMLVDVEVKDVKHLTDITTALRASRVISSAERLRG